MKMWKISQIICMGILLVMAIIDIRFRKVPVWLLILGGITGILYQWMQGSNDLWLEAGGAGVGIVFLLLSKFTTEGIGYGDSLAILDLGIYLGFWDLLLVLGSAFLLLVVAGVFCLIRRKISRKQAIPFYPFLAAGYLMSVLAKVQLRNVNR